MILVDTKDAPEDSSPLLPVAGPSMEPPPRFEDSASDAHIQLDFSEDQDPALYEAPFSEPPPDFAPYDAEFWDSGHGNIVSHDPHLNKDGEALYRFLLSQARTPPKLSLHIRGDHQETRWRTVSRTSNGETHTEQESYTETVVDFDFVIGLDRYILPDVAQWSVLDTDPVYRGRMVQEILGDAPRKALRKEKKKFGQWRKRRDGLGLPPWVAPDESLHMHTMRSTKTVRQWADQYCESPKKLKEFTYVKTIYGWDLNALERAVRRVITGTTLYQHNLVVSFERTANKIYIRSDNRLSRALSNKWIKFLSIILFIFPFIWLWKRFSSKGGGRWEVCGGAYPMKKWVSVEEEDLIGKSKGASAKKLVGLKEADWLQEWTPTVLDCVRRRLELYVPIEVPVQSASGLAHQELLGFS
ncbi:hypothetical protein CYLTODRAFT_445755 [Cylindrobasidium torrendii FP15055 ss-10]|uniref:Uncharacterized protein n=1 Tax=Cylindrobasidium torrendii FP15055 ss-10 TaxID=1314674 RepID=A0A0D7B2J4_9AGAR|nr:hypothetical protein CYLTODRAFT_445755 [Cylindrobasidium torrendii FP15055 ss-10]